LPRGRRHGQVKQSMPPNPIALSEEDRRLLGGWAADCAQRALTLFEAKTPYDICPREAIEGIRTFVNGGKRTARLRSLAWAALAAAREVGDPSAAADARTASLAAATAYMHVLATPYQAKHALGPVVYAALAYDLTIGDGSNLGDREIRWAINYAPPKLHDIVRWMPSHAPGRTRLSALLPARHWPSQLNNAIRQYAENPTWLCSRPDKTVIASLTKI
jgi:hypothetical protein